MRHMLGKHSPDAQNAILVAETNIGFLSSDCLCEILEKIRKMNIGFVINIRLLVLNTGENLERVCNPRLLVRYS